MNQTSSFSNMCNKRIKAIVVKQVSSITIELDSNARE